MIANPLNFDGPTFLGFFALLLAAAALVVILARWTIGPATSRTSRADLLDLACLAGGALRVADTIGVVFLTWTWATLSSDGAHFLLDRSRCGTAGPGAGALGVAARTLEMVAGRLPDRFDRFQLRRASQAVIQDCRQRLEAAGLVPDRRAILLYRLTVLLVMGTVIGLGLAKVQVGLDRHRPVEFLVVMLIAAGLFTLWALAGPLRTRAGAAVLADSRRDKARAARAPRSFELPLAVAFGGLAVLAGTAFAPLARAAASSSSSGDSGSSGCGGGGGGCGGCS